MLSQYSRHFANLQTIIQEIFKINSIRFNIKHHLNNSKSVLNYEIFGQKGEVPIVFAANINCVIV